MKNNEGRCKFCKRIYIKPSKYQSKYCSDNCRKLQKNYKWKLKQLKKKKPKIYANCKLCNKKFLLMKGGYCLRKYCSVECQKKFYVNKKEKEHEMNKIERECPVCKNQFNITNINDIYCSRDCREKYYGEKYLKEWSARVPKKRKHHDLGQIMFHDLGDKPSDSSLKRFRACRG